MNRKQAFLNARRRLCVWDLEPKRADAVKMQLERSIRFLPNLDIVKLKSLDDPDFLPCDLLVVFAQFLGQEELMIWLQGFEKRLSRQQEGIWTPALILNPVEPDKLTDLLEYTLLSNWYFDIVHPDEVRSIPLRVANLLRMHDHLHELRRYEGEWQRMAMELERIDKQLKDLQK